jgi:PelA/Pel-15E family pectate lyase
MKKAFTIVVLLMTTLVVNAQQSYITADYDYSPGEWKQIVRKSPDAFFRTDEAKRIAENVLAYQRVTGGWPKNIAMHRPLGSEIEFVLHDKQKRDDSTIDNDATVLEMTFLARLYRQVPDKRYKDAFLKGVEFLLDGQYDNGGWPQFWPDNRAYQVHITYNDGAMVQTMCMIRDLRDGKVPFDNLVDDTMKIRLAKAFDKGIECILNTQIVVDGKPTVWCQQHDHVTLKPATARSYELPSFCSAESAQLVRLLMELPNPDKRVRTSIECAVKWLDEHKITGIRLEHFVNAKGQRDVRVVKDENAEPLWARFYDLDKAEPMFCDRDGVPRKTLAEIGHERRNGYGWYNSEPRGLMLDYEVWKKKLNL